MESILQGWLTKSPPEKKQFKLFGAKWRKRYFVLYAPPATDGIHGTYQALLEYYTNKKLRHKRGMINLTDCQEVLSNLDSGIYKYVFGLQTMHKSQLRTYYLAAETESEMHKWVNKMCQVLGLTENDDGIGSPQPQFPHRTQQSVKTTQPLKVPRSTWQPLTHQSPLGASGIQSPALPPLRPVPSMPNTPFTRLNISEPNLFDLASPKSCKEIRWETGDVGWQVGSPPGTSKIASPPRSSRMRNAESFPELDHFSPTTRKPGSVPGEGRELPPIPPEKMGPKVIAEVEMDYDLPKQKYKSEDQAHITNNNCYNVLQGRTDVAVKGTNGDGWFNEPVTTHASDERFYLPKNLSADDDDCYNFPKTQTDKSKYASQDEEFYNFPKSQGSEWQDYSHLPQKESSGSSDEMDDYNMPKSALAYNFHQEDYDYVKSKDLCVFGGDIDVYNIPKHKDFLQDNNFVDRPKCLHERKSFEGAFIGKQSLDEESQSTSPAHPSYEPPSAFGIIPSSSISSGIRPPEKPPRPLSRPSPDRQMVVGGVISFEVERLDSTFQPAEDSVTSENFGSSELKKTPSTTFRQHRSSVQSSSSIHRRQVTSNLPIRDSIRFTQRTKSFKRSIPSQDRSALPLPVKRNPVSGSSSSASSDEDDDHNVAVQSSSFA